MSATETFNVEAALPTLEEARRQVIDEIRRAKREGVRVLKIIHGYGSSGKGGTLCVGLRKSFGLRKKAVLRNGRPRAFFEPPFVASDHALSRVAKQPTRIVVRLITRFP